MIVKTFSHPSKGEAFNVDVTIEDSNVITFMADMDEDVDGSQFWRHDPCGQADTTLHYQGKPIDSGIVRGVVLLPELILAVKPMVLGSLVMVTWRGKTVDAVVFDVGPHWKFGEGSHALLKALGAPHTLNGSGGIDNPEVKYEVHAGVPAVLDGVTYSLQSYK
jgi:hypothetical protein